METLEKAPPTMETNALLKDLYEKKQSIRRIASEVGSMASELREVRAHMAMQEANLQQETSRRMAAEAKAEAMGKELEMLQKSLGDKNSLVFSSAALAEKNFHNLVDRSVNSGMVSEEVDIHAASVVTTQVQCNVLEKELEIKNEALVRQEAYVTKLDQQLLHLHLELQNREDSKQHLKHEVEKMEAEMKIAVYRMTNQKASELHSSLKEVKSKNTGHLMKNLVEKDEELARQREELRTLSAQLKMKARELQVQMDNHRKADQELKKRVIKLEFLLREARIQARKLQKVVEKKEKDLKDLQTQLASNASVLKRTAGFWGSSVFKFAASASALVLFIFMKH